MTNCFVFDINKCVGCHACLVACVNENGTTPPLKWREVHVFNAARHSNLPVFFHSLACNHCDDPLCLKSCPANAYHRDEETNAIIHDPDKCFGCKYCTWACPYDAPQFNEHTHLIEKCTYCNDRIKDGLKPACANLCPTGALDFQKRDKKEDNKTKGFPDKQIEPNIVFIQSRNGQKGPAVAVPQSNQSAKAYLIDTFQNIPKKISLKKEWVLVLFTLIVAIITAWFSAAVFNTSVEIYPVLFAATGFGGLLLSAVHLGKLGRVYRAIFNLRSSWLSREIFFFSGFVGLATLLLFNLFENEFFNYLTIIFAALAVVSVDMIYKFTEYRKIFGMHSAYISFTALLLFAFLLPAMWIAGVLMAVKMLLYVGRKKITITKISYGNLFFSLLRVTIGFLLPVYLYFTNVQDIIIILFYATGEVFDRMEFYNDMDVITPQKQLFKQLIAEL